MDRAIRPRRRRTVLIVAGAALAIAAAVFAFRQLEPASTYTLDGQRIQIGDVRLGVYEDFIPLRATLEPERTVYLDAIEGGRVEAVLVEEGEMVEPGQALIELSNTSLQLDVIAREAEVSEQLNNLRNTQLAIEQNRLRLRGELIEIDYQILRLTRLVERYRQLEGQTFLSQNDYQASLDELEYWKQRQGVTRESQAQDKKIRLVQIEQLQSAVQQLEKNLVLARANLDSLVVRAPRAGRLTSLAAEIGESKARGERLGQIDDVDRFKASALVSEFYLGRVSVGQLAEWQVNGADVTLEVSKLYPEVQSSQFRVDLRFVDMPPQGMRRGQALQLRLALGDARDQAVLLPNGAFYNDTGGAWVFVLDQDGAVAHRRSVQLGRRNPNQIEVDAGLVPGDRVIISSYASFIDVQRLLIGQD